MASQDSISRLSRPKSQTDIGGRFNSMLKQQTGFLSDVKKSSKLIAKNPARFLEQYCTRRDRLETGARYGEYGYGDQVDVTKCDPIIDTDCSSLQSFIADLVHHPCFEASKESDFHKKHEFMKRKSTILKIASSNLVSVDSEDINQLSLSPNGDQFHYNSATLEKIIDSYIQQIKTKAGDLREILEWIQSESQMSDLKLPYGVPKESLKIPTQLSLRMKEKSLAGFIESAIDNFLLLDGEYHAKIEQISQQIQAINEHLVQQQEQDATKTQEGSDPEDEDEGAAGINTAIESRPSSYSHSSSASRASVKSAASSTPSSPWTTSETALLTFVITSLERDTTPSIRINLIQYELTSRLFPDKSPESVINQKYYIKYKKLLEEKRCNVINDWVRDKSDLVTKINGAWDQLSRKYAENLEHRNVARKQRELCNYWSQLVDQQRHEKCERVKQLQIFIIEPLRRRREAELQEQMRREAERRQSIHEDVKNFRRQKEKAKLRQSLKAEADQELADQRRRDQDKINRVRVEYRRHEWLEREKCRKEAEEARQAEQIAHAAKLESIKEPVHIEYEPWNVISDTHASIVRRIETLQALQDANSEEQKMIKFFRESYSFSTEKVLQDRRVRLEIKLRDAGLMGSSYARQILAAMQPKVKPHLSTQIKFEFDDPPSQLSSLVLPLTIKDSELRSR